MWNYSNVDMRRHPQWRWTDRENMCLHLWASKGGIVWTHICLYTWCVTLYLYIVQSCTYNKIKGPPYPHTWKQVHRMSYHKRRNLHCLLRWTANTIYYFPSFCYLLNEPSHTRTVKIWVYPFFQNVDFWCKTLIMVYRIKYLVIFSWNDAKL